MKKLFSFILIFLSPIVAIAQDKKIKNLVFEGAGIRGIAYCGAIQELESRGLINNITQVGGTSAGAVTALCLSLGYSSKEIADLLYATNFKKLNDGKFFFAGGINRFNKYFGWYRGDKMTKWLEKIIESKTGNADITFEELQKSGFRDLYITATMLDEQRMVVLSHKTYPQMRIKDAVRISVSIPFYFEAVFIDKDGKVYSHPKKKTGLHIMADGGFIGNFPIHVFDSIDNRVAGKIIANETTIGFRIDSKNQIENDKESKGLAAMPVNNLKEYAAAFYNIIIENLNRQNLSKEDCQRTVSISDGDIGPRIRKLAKNEIDILMENGRLATKKFFEQ
jgi:NTE family protein